VTTISAIAVDRSILDAEKPNWPGVSKTCSTRRDGRTKKGTRTEEHQTDPLGRGAVVRPRSAKGQNFASTIGPKERKRSGLMSQAWREAITVRMWGRGRSGPRAHRGGGSDSSFCRHGIVWRAGASPRARRRFRVSQQGWRWAELPRLALLQSDSISADWEEVQAHASDTSRLDAGAAGSARGAWLLMVADRGGPEDVRPGALHHRLDNKSNAPGFWEAGRRSLRRTSFRSDRRTAKNGCLAIGKRFFLGKIFCHEPRKKNSVVLRSFGQEESRAGRSGQRTPPIRWERRLRPKTPTRGWTGRGGSAGSAREPASGAQRIGLRI